MSTTKIQLISTFLLLLIASAATADNHGNDRPSHNGEARQSVAGAPFRSSLTMESAIVRAQGTEQFDPATSVAPGAVPFEVGRDPLVPGTSFIAETGSLEQVERLAIEASPAIQQFAAQLDSLNGKHLQAGLQPNPVVGVNGSDILIEGKAGQNGFFFGRQIVRGNKLGLAQSIVCAEMEVARQRLAATEQRLLNAVRFQYFEVLIAQEKVKVSQQLVDISTKAVEMTQALVAAKEVARSAALQSEIELQNALVVKRQAENENVAARRKLAALMNQSEVPFLTLTGNAREIPNVDDFDVAYEELIVNSPEVAELVARVEQARRTLARARVEPIPNVTWQTGFGYDDLGEDITANFQIGMPIPTRDRNQGAIQQIQYLIVAAEREVDQKLLELRQRLASAYQSYFDSKLQLDAYDSSILPKSLETLELVSAGYQQEEVGFLQLLTAQRTYTQINLTYLEKLRELRRQTILIKGRLLSGSLLD